MEGRRKKEGGTNLKLLPTRLGKQRLPALPTFLTRAALLKVEWRMQFTLFSPQRALNFSASCLGDRGSRQSRISLSLPEAPYLLRLRSKAGKQIRSQSHKCPLQRCRNPRASPGSPLAAMLRGHKRSFSTLEQGACSNSGRDARDRVYLWWE